MFLGERGGGVKYARSVGIDQDEHPGRLGRRAKLLPNVAFLRKGILFAQMTFLQKNDFGDQKVGFGELGGNSIDLDTGFI